MRHGWLFTVVLLAGAAPPPAPIALPSSKLLSPVPGEPQRTNGSPSAAAVSPDGRWVAVLAGGFGTEGSGFAQSIAIEDRTTDVVVDQPDERLKLGARQTYFLGLAFSSDGRRLYASVASLSDPAGEQPGDTGNGIAVYDFADGHLAASGFLKIPLRALPSTLHPGAPLDGVAPGSAVPYPAGLAVVHDKRGDGLLVAEDLADEAVLLDAATGAVRARFDLSTHPEVPSSYPYGAVASADGKRGWISLWNGSAVVELDLRRGVVKRSIPLVTPASPTAPGSHPTAMVLGKDRLYVALANADAVAVVDPKRGTVLATWSTRLPGASWGGTTPNALALSPDGARLYVADAGANAVAVFDAHGDGAPLGFVPTEWYPTALAAVGDDLFVVSGKGRGTGPNDGPTAAGSRRAHPYVATLLHGSLARVQVPAALADLPALTAEVGRSNRMGDPAAPALPSAIRHVVYIIKENRTFDQILGDLGAGDGDPSLVLYGADITPNEHRLARQFGVMDRFLCSGEVSGDGHVWSTAAITSDYTEKTWPISYRGDERNYDFEGEVSGAMPLAAGAPDVDEPGTGFLWANAERNGVTHRNYGEYVASRWCDDPDTARSAAQLGTPIQGAASPCAKAFVAPGEALADGRPSPFPWPVPVLGEDVATKAELRDHFDPAYADFRMDYPDQLRADEFLRELHGWEQARTGGGADPMPQLVILRLPNDHTSGTMPGRPTPSAAVADNDLALGRVVAGIAAGPYWQDTAIFVVEDDAQDGADHVEAHRSPAFVVSRFAPHLGAVWLGDHPELAPEEATTFVDSADYTTVSVIRTIELLLGLPPMNQNDALAPVMAAELSGPGDLGPFLADTRNLDNGLIYQVNPPDAKGGSASLQMDFRHADSADPEALNRILWEDRHPGVPFPAR